MKHLISILYLIALMFVLPPALAQTSQVDVINAARDAVLAQNEADMLYPSEITVVGLSGVDAVQNGLYLFDGFQFGKPQYVHASSWIIVWQDGTDEWTVLGTSYQDAHPTASGYLPDKTGWPVGAGGTSPTLEYDVTVPAPWGGHPNETLIARRFQPPAPPSGLWYTGNGYIFYTAEGYKFILTN
jgi:hypothetical protein